MDVLVMMLLTMSHSFFPVLSGSIADQSGEKPAHDIPQASPLREFDNPIYGGNVTSDTKYSRTVYASVPDTTASQGSHVRELDNPIYGGSIDGDAEYAVAELPLGEWGAVYSECVGPTTQVNGHRGNQSISAAGTKTSNSYDCVDAHPS